MSNDDLFTYLIDVNAKLDEINHGVYRIKRARKYDRCI